uniref:Uncharacterized protein K02A2.6-like n=1 Tax=Saccoglossus kowalevskii TaxID=10224 RepID=A0ABM0MMN0_SACKO|nr:PREDICTED: uncharacterized protein K02A2.6-like [Saccoglossus kowalevskii]
MTHEIPDRPWSKIAIDLCKCRGKDYLIMVDYYSDYWEVDQVIDTTATTIINCCKIQFSHHGIPDSVMSDNGPQFDCVEFKRFAHDWEFNVITSSPYHSQSNGKIEAAVKIAKRIIKKSQRNNEDPWKAILDWRNTPTEGTHRSPVQRLMSRRTRTLLPTANRLLHPKVVDGVADDIKQRRRKSKFYYDQHAETLPELQIGQPIRMKALPTDREGKWHHRTVTRQVAPRSYNIDINGNTYRRNRKFLRPTKEVKSREIEHDTDTGIIPFESPTGNMHRNLTTQPNKTPSPIVKLPMTTDLRIRTSPIRSSTRAVRMPSRY